VKLSTNAFVMQLVQMRGGTQSSYATCNCAKSRPWELCLKLPVLCYASNSWKCTCNYYASRGSPIMLALCSNYYV